MQDVCLFAHYDKDNQLDDYVVRYLEKLKELKFVIILVSTSQLADDEIARVQTICDDVILRENAGLDFASWAMAFAKHSAAIKGRLLLANDSVYGPIGSLHSSLDRLTRTAADFYGMVESIEIGPHLQSWFLLFEPQVVRHPVFSKVLAQPFSSMTKRQIIESAEVALSRRLVEVGFHYEALYVASKQSRIIRRYPLNPTHLKWRELLLEFDVPFLKVELLRENPVGIEDSATILQTAAQIDPQFSRLIAAHVARTAPERQKPRRRAPISRYCFALIKRYEQVRREKRYSAAALARIQLAVLAIPLSVRRWIGARRQIIQEDRREQ